MKRIITLILFLFCLSPLFAQSAEKELAFYKQQAIKADEGLLKNTERKQLFSVLEWDLNSWLERNYALPSAPEAMVLKAQIEYQANNYTAAYLTLLKYAYEFPSRQADKDLTAKIINEFPNKQQEVLKKSLVTKSLSPLAEDRLSLFLAQANKLNLKNSQEYLLREYSLFFNRFPAYENNDKVELLLGDLYRNNGNYSAALGKYNKVLEIYPSTKYKAASVRMMGDIYASELKNYNLAKEHYERVLAEFPNSVEIPTVYKHLAFLEAENKNYAAAVENAQKAYDEYLKDTQKAEAYDALIFKAEVEEKDLKNYNSAVKTLRTAAEIMPLQEQYFVGAKQKEANIQAKKLKDNYAECDVLEEIAVRFPNTEDGVQALYRAAELTEKFGDTEKAKGKYHQIILNRPQSKTAVKAQKRITSIEKAAAKTAKAQAVLP